MAQGIFLRHTSGQEQLKGEDVIIVHENLQKLAKSPDDMCHWALYCVCDGHGGKAAAKYMQENLGKAMVQRLPTGSPPDISGPDLQAWGERVRNAVVDAFLFLDCDFEKQGQPPSVGCTVSLALVCGRLLTVANVGDSEAFLDAGRKSILEMTCSHKIDSNVEEQERLKAAGKEINQLGKDLLRPAKNGEEGVGPLRVWPCGLAVSRSLGDYDCGCEVTAAPHIRQVEIPVAGARLILASDGLWDHVSSKRACKFARKKNLHDVPQTLIQLAEKEAPGSELTDDTSVLVVDMVVNSSDDFKDVVKRLRGPRNVVKRFFRRQTGAKPEPPRILADYDGVKQTDMGCHPPSFPRKVTTMTAEQTPPEVDEEFETSDGESELDVIAATPKKDNNAEDPRASVSRILVADDLESNRKIETVVSV